MIEYISFEENWAWAYRVLDRDKFDSEKFKLGRVRARAWVVELELEPCSAREYTYNFDPFNKVNFLIHTYSDLSTNQTCIFAHTKLEWKITWTSAEFLKEKKEKQSIKSIYLKNLMKSSRMRATILEQIEK